MANNKITFHPVPGTVETTYVIEYSPYNTAVMGTISFCPLTETWNAIYVTDVPEAFADESLDVVQAHVADRIVNG